MKALCFCRVIFTLFFVTSIPSIAATFQFPLNPYEVTGYTFGQYVAGLGYHLGEDAHGEAGTPVYAAASGQVIHAEAHTGYYLRRLMRDSYHCP